MKLQLLASRIQIDLFSPMAKIDPYLQRGGGSNKRPRFSHLMETQNHHDDASFLFWGFFIIFFFIYLFIYFLCISW